MRFFAGAPPINEDTPYTNATQDQVAILLKAVTERLNNRLQQKQGIVTYGHHHNPF